MKILVLLCGAVLLSTTGIARAYMRDGSAITVGQLVSGSPANISVSFSPIGYEFSEDFFSGVDQASDGPLARRLIFSVNAPGTLTLANSWGYLFDRLDSEVCDDDGCKIITGPVVFDAGNQLRAFYLRKTGSPFVRYSGVGDAFNEFFPTFCGRFGPDCYMENASNEFQPIILSRGRWVLDWTGGGTGTVGSFPAQISLAFNATGPAVPEPASWLMLLAGFGSTGFLLRVNRRRKLSARWGG